MFPTIVWLEEYLPKYLNIKNECCVLNAQKLNVHIPKQMMAHQEKRQEYVDIIKGWTMLLIVVFHSSSGLFPKTFRSFLGGGMEVVFFSLLLASLLKSERLVNPKSFLQPKLKALYIPATVIYICAVLLHNVFVTLAGILLARFTQAMDSLFTITI